MTAEKRKASDPEEDIPRKQSANVVTTSVKNSHRQFQHKCHSSEDPNDTMIVVPRDSNNIKDNDQHMVLFSSSIKKSDNNHKLYIDFVEQLPFEIFCDMLSYLDTWTAIRCTQVSRTWRSKLLGYHTFWKQIEVNYYSLNEEKKIIKKNQQQSLQRQKQQQYRIPSILLQYVEKLTFYDHVSTFLNCTEFLRMHNFFNLAILDLNISVGYGANTRSPESLYSTLACVGQTLTILRIDWPRIENSRVSLLRILSLCQKLTLIKIIAWSINDCMISHKAVLSQMELHSTIAIQPLFQLLPLLLRCPDLRYLELNGCDNNEEIVPILTKCCPALITLITRNSAQQQLQQFYDDVHAVSKQQKRLLLSSPASSIELSTAQQKQQQQQKLYHSGELQCLILHNVKSVLPIHSRLEKSHNSLHTLSIAPMGGLERDWARLSTLALPKLTYLHIKISDVTTTNFLRSHLPSMLHQYHSLETLALEGPYLHSSNTFTADQGQDYHDVIADRIFNAIGKLPNLSSLHLSHFDIRSRAFRDLLNRYDSNNNSLAKVFFPQCNQQQQQQHNYHYHRPSPAHLLRELTFHHCIGVTLGILQNVSKISSLKKLSIYRPEKDVTLLDIALLIRFQLYRLTCLELGLMQLDNESATILANCKNLSTLLLYKVNGAGKDRVDQLLRPYIKDVKVQWR